MRFRVGDATVTPIVEMVDSSFDVLRFFPLATEAEIAAHEGWMAPRHFNPQTRRIYLSMHSWLVEAGGKRILIDGCVGNDKTRDARPDWCNLSTAFLDRLAEAGARPEDIDYVLCTHLHADHVGWNTRLLDGRWVPTFPNATYVFGRREHAYWQARNEGEAGGPHLQAYRDSVLPIVEAGRALIVDEEAVIAEVLHLEPAPGHTPGHVAVWLRSGQESGAFTGDIIHHPVQVFHPEWSCMGCIDPAEAARTRRRTLAQLARTDGILFPGHFMDPHAARIAARGDGFAFRFLCEEADAGG